MMEGLEFANPGYLYLLLIIPLLAGWAVWRDRDRKNTLRFSSFSILPPQRRFLGWMRFLPLLLRLLSVGLIVVALARPQSFSKEENATTEGIDIMMSLDVSGSMQARDFSPNRLEAAKKLGMHFVSGRPNDRMGLVIFARDAYTMCPLTVDHATLLNQLNSVQMGMIDDGTAIGSGLATAVNRLLHSDAVSRVVILLTDGVNNSGEIAPYTAAEIAQSFGIRVYVIGVGSQGTAPFPVQTPFGVRYQDVEVHLDEPQMREMAALTGGQYFRATDNKTLAEVYDEIDKLEKSKIHVDEFTHRSEEFSTWLLWGIALLLADMVIRHVALRMLP